MKTDLRNMMYFATFTFVLTTFCADLLLYGNYVNIASFPSYTLLSYINAQTTVYASLGTHFGYPFGFLNAFTWALSYFFAIFYWIASVLYYIFDGIYWFFGLLAFPFSYIPSPFNALVTTIFFAFIGISLLTAVRGPGNMGMEPT